jgi:hypothetical protein
MRLSVASFTYKKKKKKILLHFIIALPIERITDVTFLSMHDIYIYIYIYIYIHKKHILKLLQRGP